MLTTSVFDKNLIAFNDKKTIIINQGGQHSSKTYSILQIIIFLAKITKNKVFTIVAESIPFLKVGVIRQFIEILTNENLFVQSDFNQGNFTYKIGSNIIEFKAYDHPSKAVGAKRDFLFINEAININYETFINLESRTNICTWIDYNPSYEFWCHDKLIHANRDDVAFVHSTYKDNDYLPQKIIDTIERYKDYDPNRYRVMGLGLVGSNEGLVFNNWTTIDSSKLEEQPKVVYGIDFGFTNDPSTCIAVYKQDNELYVDELFYNIGMTNADIASALRNNDVKRMDEIFADSAEPKSIDELYKRGFNIKPVAKGPDSVMQGIDILKQYRLNITKRSVNLIKELRNYSWLKDKNGNLINKAGGTDHAIDALRYAVMSKFGQKKLNTNKIRII